jgi:hypothetical protein
MEIMLTSSSVLLGGAGARGGSAHGASPARRAIPAVAMALGALAAGALATPGIALSSQAAAKTVSVQCKGSGTACRAVVSVAGGASNKKLRIVLSDTDLKLSGVVAKPASIHGAYRLSGGSYSLGGSLYTVTLNAVRSIPRGATLTFNFASPGRGR